MARPWLTALFFCSGALALIYEVLWQRRFAFVFGSAAPATAAVLAAFFAGLGAGSWALGAAAKRWRRPLRLYAALEASIGAGALLVVPILDAVQGIHLWLAAFLALALPTFSMGGTLPALAQLADGRERRLGINAGLLYVANTAGAVLGALSVPFVLLPLLGASGTLALCVAGSTLLALVAWQLDRRSGIETVASPASHRESDPSSTSRWIQPLLLLSLFSGLTSFALQVLWNRAFAQVHENSVHSFAVIVALFIFALACGAQLARMALRRGVKPEKLIGWGWLGGGVLVGASAWCFLRLTDGLAFLPLEDVGWGGYAFRLVGLAAAVILGPVTLVGMALPAIMEQAGQSSRAHASDLLGTLLAVNVIGCVTGALAAGFLLPRWLGLWSAMLLTATTLMVVGAWQLVPEAAAGRRFLRLLLVFALAASAWLVNGVDWPRVRIAESHRERLVAVSEGMHGIVAVVERPGSRRLKLNNSYVLGGTAATGDERLQLHVPLLLHPSPRRAAVLGLGTGITASAALFHPIERLTAVELVPEVVEAARLHFQDANLGILTHAKTQVIVEDARSYLKGQSSKLDVLVGDLVVPWRQGESALYTAEHFTAARDALAPGGLFCQWLPLFQLSEAELQILLRTFLSVFPRAYVWRGDFSPEEPALALVAGVEPFVLDPAEIARRTREMRPDPSNPQLAEPIAIWMHFAGVLEPRDLPANETRIHHEDRPWIELIGPLRRGGAPPVTGRLLQAWLSQVRRRSAERLGALGMMELAGMEAGELLHEFALSLWEGDESAARSARLRLQGLLPEVTFKTIFPEATEQGTP